MACDKHSHYRKVVHNAKPMLLFFFFRAKRFNEQNNVDALKRQKFFVE